MIPLGGGHQREQRTEFLPQSPPAQRQTNVRSDLLVYLIRNRDRVVSNDGCSSPLFRLFTRGKKRTPIFHIKSQASNLTSPEIFIYRDDFALRLTMLPKKRRQSWPLQAKRRRPDDRTVTLSQIVHLSLRCMFEPEANFDRQRRLNAPILQPVCVVR
jgi:hypothetical protein